MNGRGLSNLKYYVVATVLVATATASVFLADAQALAFGALFMVLLCLGVVLKPLPFLGFFLVVWAPTLFLTMDLVLGQWGTVELRLSRIWGGAFTAACFVRLVLRLVSRQGLPGISKPLRWYFVFAFYLLMPLVLSPNIVMGANDLIRFASGTAVMLLIWAEVETEEDLRLVHRCLIVGTYICALVTVYHWMEGSEELSEMSKGMRFVRTSGGLGQANLSGLLAVVGFVSVVPLMYRATSARQRASILVLSAPYFLAVAVTVSRTALIELVIFVGLLVSFDKQIVRKVSHKALLLFVSISFLVSALYLKGFDQVAHRLEDVPGVGDTGLTQDRTGSGRILIWRGYLRAYASGSPQVLLFGHGIGSSLEIIPQYIGVALGAHNEYIHILFEYGIVGLFLYMGFIITLIRQCYLIYRARDGLALSPESRSFVGIFLWFFLSYSLSEEIFGWGINQLGTRIYVLAFVGMTLASMRQQSATAPVSETSAVAGNAVHLEPAMRHSQSRS
ncbi:MAG: O-antigen ligase family protein [Acidobacteriota bacterium]